MLKKNYYTVTERTDCRWDLTRFGSKIYSGGQKRKGIGPIYSVTLVEKLDFFKPLKFSKTFFGLPLQLC